jgi:hypothetical protein
MLNLFHVAILSFCFFQNIQAASPEDFLRMADTIEQEGVLSAEDIALLKPDFSDLIQKLTVVFKKAGYNGDAAQLASAFFEQLPTHGEIKAEDKSFLKEFNKSKNSHEVYEYIASALESQYSGYRLNLLKEYERALKSGLLRPGKIAELKKEWPFFQTYHKSKNLYLRIKEALQECKVWNASSTPEEENDMLPGTQFFMMFIGGEIVSCGIEQWKDIKRIFSSPLKKKNYPVRMYQCEQILLRKKLAMCMRGIAFAVRHGDSENDETESDDIELIDQEQVAEPSPIADLLREYVEKLGKMTCAQIRETRATISQFIKQEYPKLIEQITVLLESDTNNIDAIDYYGHTALMYATMHGFVEIVQLLLEHGANPFVQAGGNSGIISLDALHGPQGDFINGNHMAGPLPLLMSSFGNDFSGRAYLDLFCGDRKLCLFLLCNAMYEQKTKTDSAH